MSITYLDDVHDGDMIVSLPDFYRVRDCDLILANDGLLFFVGKEMTAGLFIADLALTEKMRLEFGCYEPTAATMRELANWMRAHD